MNGRNGLLEWNGMEWNGIGIEHNINEQNKQIRN